MDGKLVLARKNNEGVTLTLPTAVNIKGNNQVALVFDAPRNIEINRDEVEQRKRDGVPFSKETKIINKRPRASHIVK